MRVISFFSGDNLSLILPLEGRRGESLVTEGHTFSIEMVAHETLPFEQLIERDSFTDRLRVGAITYSSFETGAALSFASDTTHRAVDFNLASTKDSFPFSLVFESNLPPKGAKKVTGGSSIFPTTTHQSSTTGSTDTEVVNEYLLSGEVGIYVDSSLRYNRLPDGFYSTEIYCILTIW